MMKKGKKKLLKAERLVENDSFALSKSKGNGILRRQIWRDNDGEGEVTRYSLAYINHRHFSKDNGRVLGYDNAHGYHHKHYMGEIKPIKFKNFSDIEERFQQEFEVIHEEIRKK
jgi:hypothetical protein